MHQPTYPGRVPASPRLVVQSACIPARPEIPDPSFARTTLFWSAATCRRFSEAACRREEHPKLGLRSAAVMEPQVGRPPRPASGSRQRIWLPSQPSPPNPTRPNAPNCPAADTGPHGSAARIPNQRIILPNPDTPPSVATVIPLPNARVPFTLSMTRPLVPTAPALLSWMAPPLNGH